VPDAPAGVGGLQRCGCEVQNQSTPVLEKNANRNANGCRFKGCYNKKVQMSSVIGKINKKAGQELCITENREKNVQNCKKIMQIQNAAMAVQ
jgi:hypothetical protein